MEFVFHVRVLAAHTDAGFQLAKKCHRVYSYPTFNKAPVKEPNLFEFYIFIIFTKELKRHIRNVKKLKKPLFSSTLLSLGSTLSIKHFSALLDMQPFPIMEEKLCVCILQLWKSNSLNPI